MAYEYITKHNFPAFTAAASIARVFGQGARHIQADSIHWWGEPSQKPTFEGVLQHFLNQPGNGTSSHYVVEAGRVACGVNEADASHANGNSWANAHTVTWEANPRCSEGDYDTLTDALSDAWINRGYDEPGTVTGHNQYTPTRCPGDYDLGRIHREASVKFRAKLEGGVKPAAGDVEPIKPKAKSISQLADEVVDGQHGSGDRRRRSLGSKYEAVQAEVNRRLLGKAKPKAKSVSQLAAEVIDGKHGSGDARRRALGSRYAAVQAEVNRRLLAHPKAKSVSQLADEVLAGKHGNGAERQRSLGSRYAAVQAEINRRLS